MSSWPGISPTSSCRNIFLISHGWRWTTRGRSSCYDLNAARFSREVSVQSVLARRPAPRFGQDRSGGLRIRDAGAFLEGIRLRLSHEGGGRGSFAFGRFRLAAD
ncbi:MAG: hypothetical protein MZV63_63115 [Marinilabiliales bacterium]|nr:hypothetical protein [Marinilabiliales bacterium]